MRRSTGSWLIIVGRLVLLLVAAGAVVFALGRGHDRAESSSRERYVCPMHPEVISATPDQCPICRMALERVVGTPGPVATSSSFPELEHANYKLIASPRRRVFAQEVRAPAWVEVGGLVAAVIYNEDVTDLSPEEHALFFPAVGPKVAIDVRLAADSLAEWDRSTSRVHFRLDPRAPAPGPGEVGWLTLAAKPHERLVIPLTAVVNSSSGPYVLMASADDHTFSKRSVQIGRALSGFVVVLAGLSDEDRVVVGNTFFLDAERHLQSQGKDTPGVLR